MDFIQRYGTALSSIGAAIAFLWTVFQWLAVRSREAKHREYQTFHELLKTLVNGYQPGTVLSQIDERAAVLYELRNYPRYFPYLRRTIATLQLKWSTAEPRLVEELYLTKKYIEEYEKHWYRSLYRAS